MKKHKAGTHWIVVESFPGCLPESDPAIFDSEEDAKAYARELEAELEELEEDGTIAEGSRVVDIIACEGDCDGTEG